MAVIDAIRRLSRRISRAIPGGVRRHEAATGVRHRVEAISTGKNEVVVREYDVARVRDRVPNWDTLDREAKVERLQDLDPDAESRTSNAMLDEWHEYLVDLLDQSQTVEVEDVTHFAVGTDGTAPTPGDGGLLAEVYRTQIDTQTDQGKDLNVSGFLDSGEANGYTLRETSLTTGASGTGEIVVNRALITETVKDDTKIVTIDFTVKFRDA